MLRKTLAAAAAVLAVSGSALAASSFPPHRGDSPWSFTVVSEPSDTFVVNDRDSSTIDTYLFRPQGPIVIDVRVRRYVGPTDGNGYLQNVDDLVRRGIVAANATIRLPAFDVDESTFPIFDCDGDGTDDQLLNEVDEVYFNEEKLGKLKGNNAIWLAQTFTVPIRKIKFPSSPGGTAVNRIRVDIDVANKDVVLSSGAVGCEVWAVAVDWIGIQYKASSPVVLVHGIRSSGAVWGNFRAGLTAERVESDNTINLADPAAPNPLPAGCPDIPYNNTIQNNIAQLKNLVPAIAERYGTDSIQFATHSKGGLDSRGFLSGLVRSPIPVTVGTMSGQPVKRDLEAFSIVTLDTPHGGSVLAKYGVEARQLSALNAARAGLNVAAAKSFEGAYYCDLTPARATAFVAANPLPSVTRGASVAADADRNGNQEIESVEADGFTGGAWAANRLYQLIGRVADVTITVRPRNFLPDEITVTETPNATFLGNDVIVTQSSAGLYPRYPITGWHHLNVHAQVNATTIARDAQAPGLVDWRAR
ncbi:MAG TPA: hypothetical protein VFO85_20590 [Vicinamibacteria bacterium]|nr:hypothetical protein [Vicinamibacteria bacterium]